MRSYMDDNSVIIEFDDIGSLSLRYPFELIDNFEDDGIIIPCNSAYNFELSYRKIVYRNNKDLKRLTFGYIIPNVLFDAVDFPDDKILAKYCSYAASYLVSDRSLSSVDEKLKLLASRNSADEFDISSLYDFNSVVVLSKDQFYKSKLSIEDICLSLVSKSIYPVLYYGNKISENYFSEISKDSIIITKPGSVFRSYSDSIHELIRYVVADKSNPFSSFISLYQIFEIVIYSIFKSEMSNATAYAKSADVTAHNIKDKISKISTEKYRMNLISSYVDSRVLTHDLCEQLKHSCNDVLILLEEEGQEGWAESLYKLRNIIVHTQLKALPHSVKVEIVNKILLRVCSAMLCAFPSAPDRSVSVPKRIQVFNKRTRRITP